jgi:hypothetical protein
MASAKSSFSAKSVSAMEASAIATASTAMKMSLKVFRTGGALMGMIAGNTSNTKSVTTIQLVMTIGTLRPIGLSMLGEVLIVNEYRE